MTRLNVRRFGKSSLAVICGLLVVAGCVGCVRTERVEYVEQGWRLCGCDPNLAGYVCVPISELLEAFESRGPEGSVRP